MREQISKYDYSTRASQYDLELKHIRYWQSNRKLFLRVKEYLNGIESESARSKIEGSLVLDLGIGTGKTSEWFYNAGASCFGLDQSKEMLQHCDAKGFATTREYDLENFPYPLQDNSFDFVISDGVFYYIEDLKKIFEEVGRILKPSGVFAFAFDTKELAPVYRQAFYDGYFCHSRNSIFQLLTDTGFFNLDRKVCKAGYSAIWKNMQSTKNTIEDIKMLRNITTEYYDIFLCQAKSSKLNIQKI